MDCKTVCLIALVLAALTYAEQGKLSPKGPCPKIYDPVCASNGLTYNNECIFKHHAKFLQQKYDEQITIVKSHRRCDEDESWEEGELEELEGFEVEE